MTVRSQVNPGDIYGRLTVIDELPVTEKSGRKFLMKCSCGNKVSTLLSNLR